MLLPFIAQDAGNLNWLWYLLPLACCLLTFSQRSDDVSEGSHEIDTFYTTENIDDAFKTIEDKIEDWRIDIAENTRNDKGAGGIVRRLMEGGKKTERFAEVDKTQPRLISLNDVTGPLYFEFTSVADGGTVVKITYNPLLRGRMKRLKAALPLKIPSTPIGLNCPSCGKPVLKEFNNCPYCGTGLIKGD